MNSVDPGAFKTLQSLEAILSVLTKERLTQVAAELSVEVAARAPKQRQVQVVAARVKMPLVLERLSRDELRAACHAVGHDDRS